MSIEEYTLLDAGVNGDMWGLVGPAYQEIRTRQTNEHSLVTEDAFGDMPVGYSYNADTYCPGCILFEVNYLAAKVEIEHRSLSRPSVHATLTRWAAHLGINMAQEDSYDSSAWPKVITKEMIERPEGCGRCLSYFGMNPNEMPWCFECRCFAVECGHPGEGGGENPTFPEYRAWCENSDLHGYGEVQHLRDDTYHVELIAEDRELALAAGYGKHVEDFPIEEIYSDELRAHQRARRFADDLVKQAIAQDKTEHGEDAREDEHHVQCTDGAYLES